MEKVLLTNAKNVRAVYAGQSLSLFMNLHHAADVVSMCGDSAVEDLPVTLNLSLRRLHDDRTALSSLAAPHRLSVQAQRSDGVARDVVRFAMDGVHGLKVTVDISTFPNLSRLLTQGDAAATEHTLIDEFWKINGSFGLSMQLRAKAHAEWPPLETAHGGDSSDAGLPATPRGRAGDGYASTEVMSMQEEYTTRHTSASQSTILRGRRSSVYNGSAPRSQLNGPLFLDQALFPIVRILFVPQLYEVPILPVSVVLRNMTVQVGVARARVARSGKVSRLVERDRSVRENITVLERVAASSSALDAESRARLHGHDAICIAFNAHARPSSMTQGTAIIVARAQRLVVEDYTFEALVTTQRIKGETEESVRSAIHAYKSESGNASILDVDVDAAVDFISDRFAYMRDVPAMEAIDFFFMMWNVFRDLMHSEAASDPVDSGLDGDAHDDGGGDGEDRMNSILDDL
ncbi:hypothetical protein NESM_000163000 [Novymonas esmeraldas]|uniref:Uncharacterized protein n=1 Tax=Novymonas esmeraldas TaxID=1808958 RepID=A0AAW0F376_9TRYP